VQNLSIAATTAAAAGKPESADEGIRVAPREAIRIPSAPASGFKERNPKPDRPATQHQSQEAGGLNYGARCASYALSVFIPCLTSHLLMPASISLLVAYPKELIRAGLRAMPEKTGIKIVGEAIDVPSTLALAKKHKPAVILLDAAIPGGDAFELAGKIQKSMPATKVIMLSAVDNPTYIARAKAAGASDFLLKSVSQKELTSAKGMPFASCRSAPSFGRFLTRPTSRRPRGRS